MDVPVQNENLSTPLRIVFLTDLYSDWNVVKETKAHRVIVLGVMARGPDDSKGILDLLRHDSLASIYCSSTG